MRARRAWIVALSVFLPVAVVHVAYSIAAAGNDWKTTWGIPVVIESTTWTVVATAFTVFALFRVGFRVSHRVTESLTAAENADWQTALAMRRCPRCQYDLSGAKDERCPECGLAVPGLHNVRDTGEDLADLIGRIHTAEPGRRCAVCGAPVGGAPGGRCPACGSGYNQPPERDTRNRPPANPEAT